MKTTIILMMALILQGCASITVHEGAYMSCSVKEESREDSPTPILGGVVTDLKMTGQCLASPVLATRSDNIDWWEIFLVPLPIVDLPLSLVADVLYLPSDVAYWPKWRQAQTEK